MSIITDMPLAEQIETFLTQDSYSHFELLDLNDKLNSVRPNYLWLAAINAAQTQRESQTHVRFGEFRLGWEQLAEMAERIERFTTD